MSTEESRRGLYPEIEPNHSGWLDVGDGHELYYEECGNPRGKPVVFLHGGPGGGCSARMRRFFNPDVYRIVLFDQRGCGRSRPAASLENNTTWDLVADIEVLRAALQIKRWQVFGGSWGSTLALAYAERHPQHVTELVLRGIFLGRPQEIAWLYQHGTGRIFPEAWQHFLRPIPAAERKDLLRAYHRRLTGDDPVEQLKAAKAWSTWEGSTSQLLPSADVVATFAADKMALEIARIECHYFVNNCFLTDNQLIRDINKVRGIPAILVHGRYDVLCPAETAFELSRAWPEARLKIVADAGHSAFEPGITHELITATDTFA
jgi:proline iminopeptidase